MNINNEVLRLWEKFKEKPEITKYSPLLYNLPKVIKPSIIVIGLNPSFSPKRFYSLLKGTKYEMPYSKFKKIHSFEHFENSNIETIIGVQSELITKYSYFDKPKKIAKELCLSFYHIDLFQIRETNQTKVLGLMKVEEYKEFFRQQYILSSKFINSIKPKLILVINAKASEIYLEEEKLKWVEDLGTYIHPKLKVPVFLSGMLSGQRALDNHSFKRLLWHIKKGYNKR